VQTFSNKTQNFFITVRSHLIALDPETSLRSLSINDSKADGLEAALEKAQADMTTALSNSFDTPQALQIINGLINKANTHLGRSAADLDLGSLEKIARWITKIVGIFGLDANASPPYDGLGWASEAVEAALTPEEIVEPYAKVYQKVKAQVEGLSVHSEVLDQLLALDVDSEFKSRASAREALPESIAFPYIRGVSRIRDELRKIAPFSSSKKELLTLSDEIRDSYLTDLDVLLQDEGAGTTAFIKFIPKEEILAQRAAKAAEQQERAAQKEAARIAREKEAAEKAEKAKINPTTMFKDEEKYIDWDEKGIPTKTKEGEEVKKSARKKLEKEWERQNKAYTEWKAKSGGA
jgi:cysteinyl-tRNA synthetase